MALTPYVAPKKEDSPAQFSYVSDKAGRYQFIADRYVGDGVVKASPEIPAVITLPAGSKIDVGLTLIPEGQAPKPVTLGSFHAGKAIEKRGAAAHFGKLNKSNAENQE